MLPSNELSSVAIEAPFLEPDDERVDPLISKELGGIALSDPSQGLQVQVWTAKYVGGDVVVGSASVADTVLFSRPDITEISLSFDQNMFPAVAFTQINAQSDPEGWLWWFSTLENQHIFTQILDAYDLRLTLDDKRSMSFGDNDIILAYLKNDNLYFRAQRDRFDVEYLLRQNVNGRLRRVGMSEGLRVQFEVRLFEDSPDLTLLVLADDDYAVEGLAYSVPEDQQFAVTADDTIEAQADEEYQISSDYEFVVPNEDERSCP